MTGTKKRSATGGASVSRRAAVVVTIGAMFAAAPAHAGDPRQDAIELVEDATDTALYFAADTAFERMWSLADDAKAVVVAFTCNGCPYAVDAEDRLIELSKQWADQGVAVIAINANDTDQDSIEAMKERAAEKSFPFAYVKDATQEVAKAYGATRTPEFFVIDANRKIAYMGALDDSPDGKAVQKRYVQEALQALLQDDAPTVAETVPIGCNIRYARTRRATRAK